MLVEPPSFPDGGTPIFLADTSAVSFSGPVSIRSSLVIYSEVSCSPAYNVFHGALPTRLGFELFAPAHTTSTLTAIFHPALWDAPFVRMRVRPSFTFTPIPRDGSQLEIRARAPRVLGPHGVRIVLRTRPRARRPNPLKAPVVAPGRTVRVTGLTRPAVRKQWIALKEIDEGAATLRTVARVRTNRHGRFSYAWRPRKPGLHQLFAFYRRQQRSVTSDRTCPVFVRIVD